MNWIPLTSADQLAGIIEKSHVTPQIIYKHSTRCSISSMALHRLEKSIPPERADFNFLDLIRHRDISNLVAEQFKVPHQSPQILVVLNGECVYDESHGAISMEEIAAQIPVQ